MAPGTSFPVPIEKEIEMTTNKQKYDQYYAIFERAEKEYLSGIFPNGLPEKIYTLGRTEMEEREVTGCHIFINGIYKSSEKMSNIEVGHIRAFVENMSFSLDDVRVSYTQKYNTYYVSGSVKYSEIMAGGMLSFDRSALEEKQKANYEKFHLKDGDIPCAYCGKAIPETSAIKDYVIARQYQNYRKEFLYCSSQCASYNQMAHEG